MLIVATIRSKSTQRMKKKLHSSSTVELTVISKWYLDSRILKPRTRKRWIFHWKNKLGGTLKSMSIISSSRARKSKTWFETSLKCLLNYASTAFGSIQKNACLGYSMRSFLDSWFWKGASMQIQVRSKPSWTHAPLPRSKMYRGYSVRLPRSAGSCSITAISADPCSSC